MRQKTQGNVKRRGHGSFGGGGELTIRCRTGFAGAEFVLVGNNYAIAFCQAADHFCKIESAKSNADRARMHNAALHHQRLIDKKRACRHEKSIFVCRR